VDECKPLAGGLLRLVADELPNFNDVNVATAISKLGKLCGSSLFPRNIAADDCFRGLMVLACDMCDDGRLQEQAVANIVHAMSKMSAAGKLATDDAGVQNTLAALEQRLALVASSMEPQGVSNTVYGFALLGRMPGAKARAALEVAVVRVALDPDMVPQAVSNTLWALATLGWEPGAEARAALEAALVRLGPLMNAQEAANTTWSFATLGLMPGAEASAALQAAVLRVGPLMNAQEAANTTWSFATLGLMPGTEAWAALEAAVVRVGPDMNAQAVANIAWSFATLGLMPGAEAFATLDAAGVRVARDMTPQAVANTLFGLLTLAATRGAPLPACYPALWQAACGFDSNSFGVVGLRALFQAHLIHTELVNGDVLDEVTFPPWIMHEAREAWMRQAQEEVKMVRTHREIASILGELGIPHEVEHLTDDGYFSVDVYLPGGDIALELDGPTHFIAPAGEGGAPGDAPRTTRTTRTELRDMFLMRRHRVVLSVPWFEYAALNDGGAAEKNEYVAAKLRAAGVSIPAAT
jgi:molybdopterin-binding protein